MEAVRGDVMWQPVAPDARRIRGFSGWDLILIVNLGLFALLGVLTLLAGPAQPIEMSPEMRRLLTWIDVALGLVLFAALPLIWLFLTRVEPLEGTLRFLRLKNDDPRRWPFWLAMGCLLGVGLYGAVLALFWLLHTLGVAPGGDPHFDELAQIGNWPLFVAIAVGAGVGEEIFFRGLLQRWLGWAGQGILFGALHVNQGFIAVVFIIALGLLFGWLLKKGMPLWGLMIAHPATTSSCLARAT